MVSIYNALTANGTLSASGIKNLKVFYDTLLINIKADNKDITLIENINFDYDTNLISALDNSTILNFGDTFNYSAEKTNGNGYIDTVFLEKEKVLLICGLSSCYTPSTTQFINSQAHSGSALTPVVYEYNINTHKIKNIFPTSSAWSTNVIGNIYKYKDIAVSFNVNTNILNYLIKAKRIVNNAWFYFWTDYEMKYSQDRLTLTSVRCLTSLATNNVDIVSFRNFNDSEKIVVTTDGKQLISFNI
jgi:hypothetical protein